MLLTGRTGAETAGAVRTAAEAVARDRGIGFSDSLAETGMAHPEAIIDRFLTAVATDLVGDAVGEVQLTADDVIVQIARNTDPTEAELALGFAFADFASGGEGVYDELPLADDVLLALGPEVVAQRRASELFRRSAWTLNRSDYAGRAARSTFSIWSRRPPK